MPPCIIASHLRWASISQASLGMGKSQIFPSHPSPLNIGHYFLHLQSRGVQRAIKVSPCSEIIIGRRLGPGIEIMSAPIRPRDREEVGECETRIQGATDRRDDGRPAVFFKMVAMWFGLWTERGLCGIDAFRSDSFDASRQSQTTRG